MYSPLSDLAWKLFFVGLFLLLIGFAVEGAQAPPIPQAMLPEKKTTACGQPDCKCGCVETGRCDCTRKEAKKSGGDTVTTTPRYSAGPAVTSMPTSVPVYYRYPVYTAPPVTQYQYVPSYGYTGGVGYSPPVYYRTNPVFSNRMIALPYSGGGSGC